jgi:predicted transcriptional regulator
VPNTSGRGRGALEREVLASLAAAERPMTANAVLAELGGQLAYTTVMTTLARLHAKHAVTRTLVGRAYAYRLAGGPDGARASVTAFQMHRLLDSGEDRSSVLSRFVAELSPTDERLLQRLLQEETDQSPADPVASGTAPGDSDPVGGTPSQQAP